MTGRYRFISEHAEVYGVTRLCRVLAVKRRQGYYEWLAAEPARQTREADDEPLAALIRAIQAEHRGYGAPRVTAELRRRGRRVNRKRVEPAHRRGRVRPGAIFHPDRGSQGGFRSSSKRTWFHAG